MSIYRPSWSSYKKPPKAGGCCYFVFSHPGCSDVSLQGLEGVVTLCSPSRCSDVSLQGLEGADTDFDEGYNG